MEHLQYFIQHVLVPIAGEAHFGLFLLLWLSAINPIAPPEEAFTLLTGACIATGVLNWFWGSVAIIAGIILCDITQYWMGRGGLKLLSGTRLGKRFMCSHGFLRAKEKMATKGIWAIIGCRFFFGTRAPTYMASGFLHYKFWKFVLIDSSIVLLHGIAFVVVGYIFYHQIDAVILFIEKLGIWSLVILLVLIAGFVTIKIVRGRTAQRLDPDPA
jgi:membrane protein DedA with SNARE-associated domain